MGARARRRTWYRGWVPAGVAALAMLFASMAPVITGHEALDLECAPAVTTAHDHNAHRIVAPHAPAADHCAACHLTRTVRGGAEARLAVGRVERHERAAAPAQPQISDPERRRAFTRGPPRIA